jgi:hypothetical protein
MRDNVSKLKDSIIQATDEIFNRRKKKYNKRGLRVSRGSVVGITVNGLDDGGVGVRVPAGSRIFISPYRPDRLWGSPNLLSNEYRGLFHQG